MQCLNKDPAARPRTWDELRDGLLSVRDELERLPGYLVCTGERCGFRSRAESGAKKCPVCAGLLKPPPPPPREEIKPPKLDPLAREAIRKGQADDFFGNKSAPAPGPAVDPDQPRCRLRSRGSRSSRPEHTGLDLSPTASTACAASCPTSTPPP